MIKKIATLKEVHEDYWIVPKSLEKVLIGNKEIDLTLFFELCEMVDYFEVDCIDDDILKNGFVCYSSKEKKVSEEEEQKIKNDTGSIKELSDKYGYSVGTIHKIRNNNYR